MMDKILKFTYQKILLKFDFYISFFIAGFFNLFYMLYIFVVENICTIFRHCYSESPKELRITLKSLKYLYIFGFSKRFRLVIGKRVCSRL